MNRNEAVRRLTEIVRRQHLALATERTYCAWLRRDCHHTNGFPFHLPARMSPPVAEVKPLRRLFCNEDAWAGSSKTAPLCRPTVRPRFDLPDTDLDHR